MCWRASYTSEARSSSVRPSVMCKSFILSAGRISVASSSSCFRRALGAFIRTPIILILHVDLGSANSSAEQTDLEWPWSIWDLSALPSANSCCIAFKHWALQAYSNGVSGWLSNVLISAPASSKRATPRGHPAARWRGVCPRIFLSHTLLGEFRRAESTATSDWLRTASLSIPHEEATEELAK